MRDLMQEFIAQLIRLYLPAGALVPAMLEQHLPGATRSPLSLETDDGRTRALVIAFDKQAGTQPGVEEARHWRLLCLVANALQTQLDLPAPAVSISGSHGYRLWLSFEVPLPCAAVAQFLALLRTAYFPDQAQPANATVHFPPAQHPATGLCAAFINPGLGASFADECGLEMPPPIAGQLALLEGLNSISEEQLAHAINVLEQAHAMPLPAGAPTPVHSTGSQDLLLKDATLEDIVRHLHALHIEPTFRHLIQSSGSDKHFVGR